MRFFLITLFVVVPISIIASLGVHCRLRNEGD